MSLISVDHALHDEIHFFLYKKISLLTEVIFLIFQIFNTKLIARAFDNLKSVVVFSVKNDQEIVHFI